MKVFNTADRAADEYLHGLFYGPPGSGKTTLVLTFPGIVLVDFEEGWRTAKKSNLAVPVVQPQTEEEIWDIVTAPELFIKDHITPQWPDYKVQSFAFDTISSMQDIIMENILKTVSHKRVTMPQHAVASLGKQPSLEDFGVLYRRMSGFMKLVRHMPFNTVLTAHALVKEDKATKIATGLPMLVGDQLQHAGGRLSDLFLYLEAKERGGGVQYLAWTIPHGYWNARVRMALPPTIENPTYEKLLGTKGGEEK